MDNERPDEYYVEYEDTALYARAVAEAGGHSEDTDPADYWRSAEPSDHKLPPTLAGAKRLAARLERNGTATRHGTRVYRRHAFAWDGFQWDWQADPACD